MISVLTLTYQRYNILQEAIKSYLCQDFDDNSEMVIINDSPEVEYVYEHPNIRIINCKQRFKSISAKLEFGYKQCKYNYIYRLDDDDLLLPWSLSLVKECIQENPGYEIYKSKFCYLFTDNKFVDKFSSNNTGNVYTKKYLDRIKFPDKSGDEDEEITFGNNSKLITIDKNECTMIYRWGGGTYHISNTDMGFYLPLTNEEVFNLTDSMIKNKETGIINITPSFLNDYYSQIKLNNMKISFCTTCMNRTDHLKQTLPHNIKLITKYNCELVLVNYDSKDDMQEFVINNYKEYIENKTINYIKIENKEFFDRFHAKNIAHRYTTGDVLVNLDADNFLTDDVITLIFDKFQKNMNSILRYFFEQNEGFIAISRDNFFKLGGYNEEMKNWGFEDDDIIHRAKTFLLCEYSEIEKEFVKFIKHSDESRFENLENKNLNKDSYIYNINIFNSYYTKGIMNPNLYNGIEWGKK